MISFEKFWQTLKDRNISQYKLTFHYGISNSQISRIKKGEHITTATLDTLCSILHCRVEDIITYIPNETNYIDESEAVAEQPDSAYKDENNKN